MLVQLHNVNCGPVFTAPRYETLKREKWRLHLQITAVDIVEEPVGEAGGNGKTWKERNKTFQNFFHPTDRLQNNSDYNVVWFVAI